MAKLDTKPFKFPEIGSDSFDPKNPAAYQPFRDQETMIGKLMEASNAINFDDPKASLKGAILRWQRADGYAHYTVTNNKPLTVAHLPFGDAWEVESALIRGLNRAEVVAQLQRAKALRDMFAKRQEPLT